MIKNYDFDIKCYGERNAVVCLNAPYFVVATDKMFCDCPLWPGKIAKLIVACSTLEEAEQVYDGMKYKKCNRGYFSYVKIIHGDMPDYDDRKYAVKVLHYKHATAFH